MKKTKLLSFLIFIVLTEICGAQTYKLVDVDTSQFPIIEACIKASDINFNPEDFKLDNISIYENDELISPLSCKAPDIKLKAIPLSVVFALDISSSMNGRRFDMLKASTKKIIQNLPLEISEVAIASFNTEVTLNCDFTHNINALMNCIDSLWPYGGTSFGNAFLTQDVGLIDIAKQGQHSQKLIVFISDGMDNVNAHWVIDSAKANSIIVNCITICVPIGEQLKTITNKTNGNYYSNLNSEKEINNAFHKIYINSQKDSYGIVRWRSHYSCNPNKSSQLTIGKQSFHIQYQLPEDKIGSIEVSHPNVNFKNDQQATVVYKPIFIKGNNVDLNITSIENSNPDFFGIKPELFPITSKANELKMLELSFSPKDSIRASAEYIIRSKGCPDVYVKASSEGREKLLITHPQGGEEYLNGSKIPITWDGIAKSIPVDFYFQKKNGDTWTSIGSGTMYKKDWSAAAINDSVRIKGVVSGNITFANLITAPVSIFDGSSFKSAIYNKYGNEILSLSTNGELKSWNAENGKLINTFEMAIQGDYTYMPGFNRIINIDSQEIKVFTNRNGLLMKKIASNESINLTSLTHFKNKELYISLDDYNLLQHSQDSKYLDVTSSPITKYSIARDRSKLHIFKTGLSKKEFSIRLEPSFQKSILHRNKAILAVSNTNNTQLYNLKTRSLIHNLEGECFYQFSRNSRFAITQDSLRYHIYYLENGNRVYSLKKQNDFTISSNGSIIAQVANDSLTITDISTRQTLWCLSHNNISQYQFFPYSDRFLFLQKDSLIILNLQQKKIESKVFCQTNLINHIEISPNEESLLITCDNVIASIKLEDLLKTSSLGMEEKHDTYITPYFKIISPEPEVSEKITFGKQYLQIPVEKVFPDIIRNSGKHNVFIDSIYVESANSCFSLVSSHGDFPVKPFGKSDVEIRFTPQNGGLNKGRLIIVCGNKKYYCGIEGTGIIKDFENITPQINFPAINVHSLEDTIVPLIKNTGNEPLFINNICISPKNHSNFSITSDSNDMYLPPSDTLWVNISFSPSRRGRQNAHILVRHGNKSWIKSSNIYGEGISKRKVIISGKTIHAINKGSLSSLINLTALNSGNTVKQVHSDRKGDFTIEANADLNYSIDAYLDGYFSSSENINLMSIQNCDTLWINLELMPITKSSTIKLNNIFFESGKAELLDISKGEMLRIVAFMNEQKDLKIEIHGHTDNIGNSDSNEELSRLRALAVKTYITQHNISGDRISIKYFGESQPIDDNNSDAGRKANRRVEILFLH